METKDVVTASIAGLALIVAAISLGLTILQRRRERVESVIEGLRGDRRAVTYAALTIRLSQLLKREDYRKSLVASLVLAWNFETSDRARSAVLAALVDAKERYADDYQTVISDLAQRFDDYAIAASKADINRGKERLADVIGAVEKATQAHGSTKSTST